MAEEGKIKIDKFDGQDFGWWKMQIEDLLCQKDLMDALNEKKPEEIEDDKWKILDRKALAVIRLTLTKSVAFNIVNETTTYGLMKTLSNMYEKPSASNKVFLIRQLVNARMKEGASVTNHINNFNNIISRLISVDIKFDDEVQALLLLSSLPESWSGSVTAISGSTGTSKLSFEGIRDFILGEDIRRKNSGESSGNLLSTEERGRRRGRGNNRGRSKSRRRSVSKTRKDIQCWNCQETGHFRNQCTKPSSSSKGKEVNVASDDSEEVLICCIESAIEAWIMDSGASFHATSSSHLMKNLRTGNFGKVRLTNNHSLDITGIGDLELKTSLGTIWTLKDVRVIPGLKKRLISVGQLDDQGYDVLFSKGQWKVVKGNLVIARGKKRGTLYMVEVPVNEANAVSSDKSITSQWHQRLGHMSDKGMKILVSNGKIPDLKKVESDFCESCVLGKKKRVTFTKTGRTLKAQKLELIHTDVFGPTPVSSLGGARYYVTFIDDSTRKGRCGPGLPTNTAPQKQIGGPAVNSDPSLNQAVGLQVAMAAAIVMAETLGGGQTINNISQIGTQSQPTLGTNPLTLYLAKIPKGQLIEVLTEMKVLATQNKEQARQLLLTHPQLSKAILQAHIMLKAVPPHMLQMPNAQLLPGQRAYPPVQGGQLGQQSSIHSLSGLPPLAQNKVPFGLMQQSQSQPSASLVPSQYAASSLPPQPRFQTPLPTQHQVLHYSTLSGLSAAGNLQSLLPKHNSQLVVPIQPSTTTHKPSSSIGPSIPNNGSKDHLSNNPLWGLKVDNQPTMASRLHEKASFNKDKDQIIHPAKLLKMEDGRGASFSPADVNVPASVPLSGKHNVKSGPTEVPPGAESALLQQVLSLTPEQLSSLSPEQQQQVIQLQQMLRQST